MSNEPPEPSFVVDRCLPPGLADALRAAGVSAIFLHEEFPQDAEDALWIPAVAASGRVILSADTNIGKRPAEKRAVYYSAAKLIVLATKKNMTGATEIGAFVGFSGRLCEVSQAPGPFIAKLYKSGDVRMYLRGVELIERKKRT